MSPPRVNYLGAFQNLEKQFKFQCQINNIKACLLLVKLKINIIDWFVSGCFCHAVFVVFGMKTSEVRDFLFLLYSQDGHRI